MRIKMKRFLGILLSLALVLSLFLSESLTAYADNTETLLTTITATGKEQASYSTANVATVSFSYTAGGSSAYVANWGWWGYGWTATVNAAEGYNITKCIFYDDDNQTATDSEAPFVVETTEEDKTPKVNGTPIVAYTSKGIKKIEVYGYATPAHTHSFNYSATGATITATCSAEGCTLPEVEGKHIATLTIAAPLHKTYGDGKDATAVITDTYSIQGEAKVQYQKKSGGSYGTATETAPTDAGDYKASITVGGATASVEYTIAQADPTANAPIGLTATYGQTLANVSLEGKNPEGNTQGTWAWADAATTSVGSVGAHTFKANFTPMDTTNYNSKSNVDVTVTVGKAANPTTVTGTATVIKGGNTVDLANNVTKNGATGDVGYAIDGEAKGCTLNGSVLTSGDTTGTVTVNVTVAADGNYEALAATPITVTISDKGTQTITAADVTATYGDTDKSVSATVTEPATGGGAISYAVKDGSGDYIDVNATTGALTIKKVPSDGKAYVVVTAAGTAAYEQATKDVTVTINKANAVAATVTANNRTFDSTEKPLVTVDNSTLAGGTMWYALGENATTAPADNLYTTDIPAKTDAGTYYVWYRVKGDLNHNDSAPDCVTVYITNSFYTVTSVENREHTIDYPNDIIITVKRNVADDITFSMYTGASVDGNGIPADGSSVAQGSLILTLKGSYLDTLSTGTHKVTISFKDGSADATISIVNAPPAPTAAPTHVPKTGDGANPALWIGLILLGFLGIIAFTGLVGRKHRNR